MYVTNKPTIVTQVYTMCNYTQLYTNYSERHLYAGFLDYIIFKFCALYFNPGRVG